MGTQVHLVVGETELHVEFGCGIAAVAAAGLADDEVRGHCSRPVMCGVCDVGVDGYVSNENRDERKFRRVPSLL